ncbi:hypothetical protein CYY_008436 [Polysphondylium violaceum]|uniref:Transmembrane protein n=1 Tax=Polysphondylium violaceum TaxID=133409 RepID=A0A8J4PLL9_9MYCE|nr:hypothetical protein CYY_008436 [Polysphondylium violaceum]
MSFAKNILYVTLILCVIFALTNAVDVDNGVNSNVGENLMATKKYCSKLSKLDCILNELTKFTCIWLNNRCEVY